MAKFTVELKEVLTYYITVEAQDADDAWDAALKTRKFCEDNFDDNDTECESIYEVPAHMAEEFDIDEEAK